MFTLGFTLQGSKNDSDEPERKCIGSTAVTLHAADLVPSPYGPPEPGHK